MWSVLVLETQFPCNLELERQSGYALRAQRLYHLTMNLPHVPQVTGLRPTETLAHSTTGLGNLGSVSDPLGGIDGLSRGLGRSLNLGSFFRRSVRM